MKIPLIDAFRVPAKILPQECEDNSRIESLLKLVDGFYHFEESELSEGVLISTYYEAAEYCLNNPYCSKVHNKIKQSVVRCLDGFVTDECVMPDIPLLDDYKERRAQVNLHEVNAAIQAYGVNLSADQILFHCGDLHHSDLTELRLSSPLSVSFSPRPAILNALYGLKFYNSEAVYLYLLTVKSNENKGYPYCLKQQHDRELEVLLGLPITLEIKKQSLITTNLEVGSLELKDKYPPRMISAFLVEAEIR